MKQKWYLQTWIICILCALWFIFRIPRIIEIVLLVLKIKEEKNLYNQVNHLIFDNQRYAQMMTPQMQNAIELQKHIEKLRSDEFAISNQVNSLYNRAKELDAEIANGYIW